MSHTPFIVIAYAVFFITLALDCAAPLLGKRRALERIRAQLKRARSRGQA